MKSNEKMSPHERRLTDSSVNVCKGPTTPEDVVLITCSRRVAEIIAAIFSNAVDWKYGNSGLVAQNLYYKLVGAGTHGTGKDDHVPVRSLAKDLIIKLRINKFGDAFRTPKEYNAEDVLNR